MGRYDVYAAPGQGTTGYVLDVRADLLQDLGTRVVVPLLPPDRAPKPPQGLKPAFEHLRESLHTQPSNLLTSSFLAASKRPPTTWQGGNSLNELFGQYWTNNWHHGPATEL